MDTQLTATCKVVPADGLEVEVSSGSMTRLAGVSKALAGTEGIHLAIATIPPACAASPHYHVNCESAIYVVKGRGRFLSGKNLQNADKIGAGDFIYVPPNSVHQPINDSTSESLELIVARNTPVEIVVEYDPEKAEAPAD
ncbi:MAG: cupin domain-containing protein [Dehalococcoidia bacterium]|nr:cupin domain-containing protein [Dehalococcoidia bacterium]